MRFSPLAVEGAWLLEEERAVDERGWFARTFCTDELGARGLDTRVAQRSVSFSHRRGTLRGMHWQAEPAAETKLIRCNRGGVHDVIVDLRPTSATYRRWAALELRAGDGRSLYVPEGVAHGFLTLEDDTEVDYQMSVPYAPASARGARWDDPAFGIEWPAPPTVISERDRTYPDFAG